MSRKLLTLAVLASAFTLFLGATEAQARHCRSHSRSHGCCQNGNYGQDHHGYYQTVNYGNGNGCQQQATNYGCQQASYVATSACCNPQPTCCGVQPTSATAVMPADYSAPQPPTEQAPAPAPAPGT